MKARIGNAIGPYEDLLTTVKRRKLKWYGHVTRSSGLAKTILQGTVQGGRRRGRQRKRWEDNIKEWTGLPWNITLRKAENREEWRKLVVKSTVVPQRSARLRDRSDKRWRKITRSCIAAREHTTDCWLLSWAAGQPPLDFVWLCGDCLWVGCYLHTSQDVRVPFLLNPLDFVFFSKCICIVFRFSEYL